MDKLALREVSTKAREIQTDRNIAALSHEHTSKRKTNEIKLTHAAGTRGTRKQEFRGEREKR